LKHLHALLQMQGYRGREPFDLIKAPVIRYWPHRLPGRQLIRRAGAKSAPDWMRGLLRVPRCEDAGTLSCAYLGYRLWGQAKPASGCVERLVRLLRRVDDTGKGQGRLSYCPFSTALGLLAVMLEWRSRPGSQWEELLQQGLGDLFRWLQHWDAAGSAGHGRAADSNARLEGWFVIAVLSLGAIWLERDEWGQVGAETIEKSLDSHGFPFEGELDGFHCFLGLAALKLVHSTNGIFKVKDDRVTELVDLARERFMRKDGLINHHPGRVFPVDCRDYAAAAIYASLSPTGIWSLGIRPRAMLHRADLLTWLPKRNRYSHRVYKWRRDRRLFLRWNQAWMFLALAAVHHPDPQRPLWSWLQLGLETPFPTGGGSD